MTPFKLNDIIKPKTLICKQCKACWCEENAPCWYFTNNDIKITNNGINAAISIHKIPETRSLIANGWEIVKSSRENCRWNGSAVSATRKKNNTVTVATIQSGIKSWNWLLCVYFTIEDGLRNVMADKWYLLFMSKVYRWNFVLFFFWCCCWDNSGEWGAW